MLYTKTGQVQLSTKTGQVQHRNLFVSVITFEILSIALLVEK